MLQPLQSFSAKIIQWQRHHGRHDLPWQINPTPYRVWISEVMLQQTQVTTAIPYYQNFMQKFPHLNDLANASTESVLAAWSGLGYYRRAHFCLKAAQLIQTEYQSQIPEEADRLMQLPGIGKSTAHAILSLACNQALPILDGNVKRIFARVFCVQTTYNSHAFHKELWSKATQLMPQTHARAYNQGLMDLGSTVCLKKNPLCNQCPVADHCLAFQQKSQQQYPIPAAKKTKPLAQTYVLLAVTQGECWMQQRPSDGIWPCLWSLPSFDELSALKSHIPKSLITHLREGSLVKHSFTHYHLHLTPVILDLACPILAADFLTSHPPKGWVIQPLTNLSQLGMPAPIRKIIDNYTQNLANQTRPQAND